MKKAEKITIAKNLLMVRTGQMIINEKYKRGLFKVPIHLAFGHEAIAVAVDYIMDKKDRLILSHRNIHYNLARIKSIKPQLDEYLLKKDGLAEGKLGSMNLDNEKKNIIYTSSILGNNLSVAAGIALGKKLKYPKALSIVVTGDGAIEEGSFYESLIFAKSNNLNYLVIIENNDWSLATQTKERRCGVDVRKIAESMGIFYQKIEGNNVYKCIEILNSIKKRIIKNKKPAILEVKIATLGGYFKINDKKNREYVNYHAGPVAKISLANGIKIENSEKDPVYVLEKRLGKNFMESYMKNKKK